MEENLVLRLKNGDESVMDAIYILYKGKLEHLAYPYVGEATAADFIQDVFISLWNNRATLKDASSIENYLCKGISNKCKGSYRTLKRKKKHNDYLKKEPYFYTIDQILESNELKSRISAAFEALPGKIGTTCINQFIKGLSQKENAKSQNIEIQTVKNYIKIGREKLREYLENYLAR
jgi:RNA polymerase sigma factor (sigma-70 family)